MPYPLRKRELPIRDPRPGDCWYVPAILGQETSELSPKYWTQHHATRAPIIVMFPDGTLFLVDRMSWTREQGYYGDGWDVTGSIDTEPPTLHLSPSVNIVGSYHGWLQNGVITDDIEGRAAAHAAKWSTPSE